MSKGPGRWQREIFATLERHSAFFERDLLGIEPSRSEQAALQRAITTLHDAHKIGLARWCGRNAAGSRLVIYRVEKAECRMAHDQIERFMESLRNANVDPDVAAAVFKAMFEKQALAPHPSEIARLVEEEVLRSGTLKNLPQICGRFPVGKKGP
jgi:hypothetical protein